MENHSTIMREIINDLLRSMSAALIHLDDLIMKTDKNSDGFSDVILTNEQLSRSIELFLDLRSECNYLLDQIRNTKDKLSGQLPTSKLLNILKLNGRE